MIHLTPAVGIQCPSDSTLWIDYGGISFEQIENYMKWLELWLGPGM